MNLQAAQPNSATRTHEAGVGGRIDSLQALRAIAAVLVMLFHMDAFMPEFMGFEFAGNWFFRGEAGVDVFFVLSGFIIYYSVASRTGMTRRDFSVARFIRLFPIYWFVVCGLVLAELAHWTNGHPERLEPGTIVRSMLLLPSPSYVLGVAWTLVLEVMFYAVFALTFFRSEISLIWSMAVWSLLAVCARVVGIETGPFWLSGYVLYSGVAEFAFGVAIARWASKSGARPLGSLALAMGAVGLLIALSGASPEETLGREVVFGLPSALLVYGAYAVSPRIPNWLAEIGNASYVLYLTHGVFLSVLLRVARKLDAASVIGAQPTAWLAAVITVAGACAVHRFFERPLIEGLRGRWG